MRKKSLITITAILISFGGFAQQFDLSAELRPRYENRHGFGSLIKSNEDGSNFVAQRTRLNFDFKNQKLKN